MVAKLLPKLLQLEEVLDINSPQSTSKAVLKVTDALKCTVTQDESRQSRFKLHYSGEGHSVTYDVQRGDLKAKLHRELGGVRFKISQTVPQHKWFLIPSPRVKATTSLLGERRDELYAKWDFLRRGGKIGDRIYFDLDGGIKCKTFAEARSDGSMSYGLRAKLNQGIAHSAAARFSTQGGAQYVLKSRPLDKARLKATYLPAAKRVELEGRVWPTFLTRNLLLTVKYAVPLEDGGKEGGSGSGSGSAAPNGTVSLKWTF